MSEQAPGRRLPLSGGLPGIAEAILCFHSLRPALLLSWHLCTLSYASVLWLHLHVSPRLSVPRNRAWFFIDHPSPHREAAWCTLGV